MANGPVFLFATGVAGFDLFLRLRPLLEREPRHRSALLLFGLAFILVAIQLAWSLRPLVGNPDEPFELFRTQAFTNAYEALIARILALI